MREGRGGSLRAVEEGEEALMERRRRRELGVNGGLENLKLRFRVSAFDFVFVRERNERGSCEEQKWRDLPVAVAPIFLSSFPLRFGSGLGGANGAPTQECKQIITFYCQKNL